MPILESRACSDNIRRDTISQLNYVQDIDWLAAR